MRGRLGATLVVRVEGARATEVEHLGPRIIERVNQFYGYRAIDRLKVTQVTGSGGGPAGFAMATQNDVPMAAKAQALGLIVRPLGGDVIAVCPPMCIEEAEIDLLLERFGRALDDTTADVKGQAIDLDANDGNDGKSDMLRAEDARALVVIA